MSLCCVCNNSTEAEKTIEEHHAILFLIEAAKHKYGNINEEIKKDFLAKKESSPKQVPNKC